MNHLHAVRAQNVTKTWILMGCFLGIFVALGYVLGNQYNNSSIFVGFLLFSIGMNVVSYWFSDKIVLKMSGAKLATREEFPEYFEIVAKLSNKAGLPMPAVYVMRDTSPNAFATGRDRHHAAVAVTTGLLALLSREELEGVVAHELAHIDNKDMLLATVVAVLVGSISIAADFALRNMFFGSRDSDNRGGGIGAIIGIVLLILLPIVAMIIQLAISRKREFMADASGALLVGKPQGLATALQKISSHKQPLLKSHVATAHLFISNPLKDRNDHGVGLTKFFMTHPPVSERVRALLGQ